MSLKKQFLRSDLSDLGLEGRSWKDSKATIDEIRRLVQSGDLVQLKNLTRIEAAAFHPDHDIRSDLWKVLCDLHRGNRCIRVDGSQFRSTSE